jgi:hypothetical protein
MGPATGQSLERVPSQIASWNEATSAYAEARVAI